MTQKNTPEAEVDPSNASTSNSKSDGRDIAWEWATSVNALNKRVKCKLCGHEMSGGINRFKKHVLQQPGDVKACPKTTTEIMKKVSESMKEKNKKKTNKERIDRLFEDLDQIREQSDDELEELDAVNVTSSKQILSKKKRLKAVSDVRGPLDLLIKSDPMKAKQKSIEELQPAKKQLKLEAWDAIGAWQTETGIPFNAFLCPSFKEMVYKIGEYGRAMPTPSYRQLRTNIFNNQLEERKKFVESFRAHWRRFGCTIMSDGWKDQKERQIVNFLVNCPKGSVFLKSVDTSGIQKDAEYIRKLCNEVIADVGIENIVQFVSDNGSNFKAAGKLLMKEHPTLFWTPCAAHCINLVMKDLSEHIPQIVKAISRAKSLISYIYNHGAVLTMFRDLTGNSELHRSTDTRFATTYYTLSSLLEYRSSLQVLFVQDKWMHSSYARKSDGQRIAAIVSSNEFWEGVTFSTQVLSPLVEVVRMVDTERKPFMGYIYEAVMRSKERMQDNLKKVKCSDTNWKKIFEIFEERWAKKIRHPLHCAAYYLNPKYFYKIPAEKMDSDPKYRAVKGGLYKAMERLINNPNDHDQAMLELRSYTDAAGILGRPAAVRTRETIQPYDWWILNGVDVPCLQKFAIRVLSLTCSSSPCERNWSTFQNLYSKKRNKFLQQKLSQAVFIQYNRKLERRYDEENKYINGNVDRPIFLEEFDEDDDWLIPEGGGLVRECEDLTWEQVNAASGAMDFGPSTRAKRKERSNTHPSFTLLSETPNDDTLPPSDIDSDESNDSNFQFELDYDKRMEADKSNGANGDKNGNEEEDDRVEP